MTLKVLFVNDKHAMDGDLCLGDSIKLFYTVSVVFFSHFNNLITDLAGGKGHRTSN